MANLSTKTGLPSFSSADSPIVNYFTDSGFERGTNGVIPTGWAQYNDGASATPVDGTGGAAVSQVTMLVSNSSPIRGSFSAIISKDAANRQGVGYSFLFTISNVDKGVTAGVEFEMQTSANYASGDVVFYIYDVTNSVLITPRATSLPALPNFGRFISDYGLQTGTQYRFILHIATTNANAWTLKLDTMVNSTTRTAVPGAIIGKTRPVTFTGSWVSNTTYSALENQFDEWAHYQVKVSLTGAPTATSLILTMPSGRTINTALLANSNFSASNGLPGQKVTILDAGTATYDGMAAMVSATTIQITYLDSAAIFQGVTNTAPMTFANGDSVTISFWVPIVEFASSAANDAASVTQWASDDGTSDVLGPQGSLVPNVGFGTGTTTRDFSFSIPQDLRQFVRCEINYRGGGWSSASDLFPFSSGNNGNANNVYGIQSWWNSSSVYRVGFGNQGTSVNVSNVSNGSTSWATEFAAGTRFRVGLSIGGVFIGVNMANSSQLGFVAPRKGQYPLIVTSSVAGWATTRAIGIYYQDQDGNHRLKFTITGTVTSGTYTTNTLTITGVTFKSTGSFFQSCNGLTGAVGLGVRAYTVPGTSTAVIDHSSTTTSLYGISGDVELDSKPSWA